MNIIGFYEPSRFSGQTVYVRPFAVWLDGSGRYTAGDWFRSGAPFRQDIGDDKWAVWKDGRWVPGFQLAPHLNGAVPTTTIRNHPGHANYAILVYYYWGPITDTTTGAVVEPAHADWEQYSGSCYQPAGY